MARGRGGQSGRTPRREEKSTRPDDVYEAEDVDADEERHNAPQYDRVDNYEYEMPSDFEDEEIDEEAAFTEDDKKLYGHLFDDEEGPGGSGSEGSEGPDLLYSEEEGSQGEDEGSEGWSEEEGEKRGRAGQAGEQDEEEDELAMFGEGEEPGSTSDVEEEEEEGEGREAGRVGAASGSEGEEEEARHQAMLEAVGAGAAAGRKRRRREEDVVTEAYPESEYNLPAAADGELTVADLIAGLGEGRSKLGAARKVLERLEKKAAPVAAPLPGPIRARQERRAGYEEARKEVTKWLPIVKANREAPTLRFTADRSAVPKVTTTAALVAQHRPETEMEAEVAALLEAAGAHSAKAVAEAEEALMMKHLTVEEARERQNRLAKMRALLFYHEAKAKRLKKIKSKDYRRKLKKAEKRKAAGAGEEGGEDGEDIIKLREDAEFERAKERLTLKHKNTSRWARRALKRGTLLDDDTKAAVEEQLRLGQELRQRVNSMRPAKGDGSDSEGGSTSASDDEDGEGMQGGAFSGQGAGRGFSTKAKAAALDLLEGGTAGDEGELPSKGLFSLPFMRRALEKKKQEAQEEARTLLEELEGGGGDGGEGGVAAGEGGRHGVFGGGGRLAFSGDGTKQQRAWERVQAMEADSDWDSDEDEDAEAKAARLSKAGEKPRGRLQRGGRGEQGDAEERAAAAAAAVHPPTPAALQQAVAVAVAGGASGDGTSGEEDGLGGGHRQQAGRLAHHGHLFGPTDGAANGSGRRARRQDWQQQQQQSSGAEGGVSIGPSSAAAAAAANGRALRQRQQQEEMGQPEQQQQQMAFVKAKRFQGARTGYVFKKGAQGLGYYPDEAGSNRAAGPAGKGPAAARARQPGGEAGEDAQQSQPQQQQEQPLSKRAKRRGKQQQQQQHHRHQQENGVVPTAAAAAAKAVLGDGRGRAPPEEEEAGLMRPLAARAGAGALGLTQEDLIRRAFAGDDVQTAFAADKAAEVEEELPKEEVPGQLPGWGTWAGQRREPAWVAEARKKAEARRRSVAEGRADAKLQYVIVSEKWDKKSSKYKTPSVPYPFDSKETYERAMRQPLGREYNTDLSFRNFTRPAVLKDAGVIIEPIRFSKGMAQHDEQAPKDGKRAPVTTIAGGMPKRAKTKK